MFTAHFVAYSSSLPELLRRGRTTHDHQGRIIKAESSMQEVPFLPLVLLIPRRWGLGLGGWEGRGSQTPDKKLAIFSPIPILVIFNLNYFANIWKTLSLKLFSNCAGNHLKCDVSTNFVYILSSKLTSWPFLRVTKLFLVLLSSINLLPWFSTWSEITYVGSEVTHLMERSNSWLEQSNWEQSNHGAI